MEKLKKEVEEWWEMKWLWGPMVIGIGILFCYMYYKSHYCVEISYKGTCTRCIEWKEHDNGRQGKYRRYWKECVGMEYYECTLHRDSCGCDKLK